MTSHVFSLDMPNEIYEMILVACSLYCLFCLRIVCFTAVALSLDGLCRSTAQSVLAALSFMCFLVHELLLGRDDCFLL
jgi:hypothetical protein